MTLSLTMRAEAMRDAEGWSGACAGDDGDDDGDDDDDGGDYSLIFTMTIKIDNGDFLGMDKELFKPEASTPLPAVLTKLLTILLKKVAAFMIDEELAH